MILTVHDFPLTAIGTLIFARTQSSPVLTASTPAIARQVVDSLNNAAGEERPGEVGKPWLTVN